MADRHPIGTTAPAQAIPIAVKDSSGNLAYLTTDGSGNLNVTSGGGGGGAVTIADGADVTQGAIADAKVVGDNTGTVSAKLRGLNYLLNLVTSIADTWLKVSVQNTSIPTTGAAAAAEALTNVSSSASNVTLLASNANRKGAIFVNDSTSAVYVKFGATATTSSFTYKLFATQTLELPWPIYTGQIDAIWDSANGAMRVTETT